MPFINATDGTRLYWCEWGAGAPMLFLSSLGMSSQMWQYQTLEFAEKGFRCITLDRRGHGRSDQPGSGYDLDTLADDIATLIEGLDLKALTLVGHSMAGGEIVRYLSRHGRNHIARAILLASTTPMLRETLDNPAGIPIGQLESVWARWRQDYAGWAAEMTAPFFVPETSPAMMRWGVNLLQQTPVPVILAFSRASVAEDFRREMREIGVPVLLIHGDRDRSAPLEATSRAAARLALHAHGAPARGYAEVHRRDHTDGLGTVCTGGSECSR